MQTIRLRRARPSSTAIALALAITMLMVYLLSLQACSRESVQASALQPGSALLRMEPLELQFLLSSTHDDEIRARVAAAQCARDGGAGLVLPNDGRYAVVYEAGGDYSGADAPVIMRRSRGLSLKFEAPADLIAAASGGISALRALAGETASLAVALDRNESDERSVSALLNVRRTKLKSAAAGLSGCEHTAAALLRTSFESAAGWLDEVMNDPSPGKIRLIQAAACLEWLELAEGLVRIAGT